MVSVEHGWKMQGGYRISGRIDTPKLGVERGVTADGGSFKQKSDPIAGATIQRGRKAGKSGKTLQGAVLTSKPAFWKLSRTMGCGEGHS
jgi:hypothetical protein